MWKIKDDVDLKELEKFGFELEDIGLNAPYLIYKRYIKPYISIDIEVNNRTIFKNNDGAFAILREEEIQDLIQARISRKGVGYENNNEERRTRN